MGGISLQHTVFQIITNVRHRINTVFQIITNVRHRINCSSNSVITCLLEQADLTHSDAMY